MLSISRNVRLSVHLSVCPSVCPFTFEVPFNGLFAPTSRSRMSNIFRGSESLGKSNGKKWSTPSSSRRFWVFAFWMIFSVFQKIGFWGILGPPSYGIGAAICIGREVLCLPYAGLFYLEFTFLSSLNATECHISSCLNKETQLTNRTQLGITN